MAFIPTPEQCALKDICRYCEEVSRKVGMESQRIKSHMARNCMVLPETSKNLDTIKAMRFIRNTWPDDKTLIHRIGIFEQLLKEKKAVEKEVCSHMKGDPNVTLLESIFGIARQSGVQIMSMIVDIRRFPTPEHLCAYFGMVPRVRDSGGKTYHGKMTKKGDRMMRMIMERITLVHIGRSKSFITRYYERKVKEMGEKKALVTASRKLLTVIHAMLTKKEPFKA
jgi:transposase